MVKHTTDEHFQRDVLEATRPTIVDFWAPWCGPCRMLGPVFERLAEEDGSKADFFKLNVDENPEIASRYGITGIPTVLVFRSGKVSRQFIGVQPAQVYRDAVAS